MNYRDLQNISNLSQEILIEGANEDHNVLNRWPYTSPYLQESTELDEGASEDVAARSEKLANQRKGQTPQRKAMYKGLALNARIRASGGNPGDKPQGHPLRKASNRPIRPHDSEYGRSGLTQSERDERRDIDAATHGEYSDGPGTKTKNPKKLRKQKAMGEIGESYDLYDIILSHLLDEGYAETQEQAEVIMVNMSEDWRESIVEGMKPLPVGKMIKQAARHSNPEQVTKMAKVADTHNPNKSQRKEDDNRREGGRKREAGRPRRNELQDNW